MWNELWIENRLKFSFNNFKYGVLFMRAKLHNYHQSTLISIFTITECKHVRGARSRVSFTGAKVCGNNYCSTFTWYSTGLE